MTPRKADLRVAHQASCAHASKTALESLKGCSCRPKFYVSWRDHTGATRKSERTDDRQLAEKMLRAQQVEIDRGNIGYQETKQTTFPEWAAEYEEILEQRSVKAATRRAYGQTLDIGRDTIGHTNLRAIGASDLDRFVAGITGTSDAIKAKHLTQLGTCLATAIDYGYLAVNPVSPFKKRLRLRVPAGVPPFTDDEVERLVAAMADEEAVYVAVVKAAVATGARIGELVALTWDCVSLSEKRMEIRHTFSLLDGLTPPKDRDARTVYLTPAAVTVLEDWTARNEAQADGLVFPAPRAKHHLNADYLRKVVAAAMSTADIPKVNGESARGEIGRRPRKPLHSLRATYTRQMLEAGRSPLWVQSNLGHANLELTVNTYGQWTDDAMLAEAARE